MSLPLSCLRFVGGLVVTTAGAGAPVVTSKCNVTVPANGTGVGDLSITLGQGGVDRTECVVLKSDLGPAGAYASSTIVHTSDTVKQILGWDTAGAALDTTVSYFFFQLDRSPLDPGSDMQDTRGRVVAGVLLTTAGAGAPTVRENFECTVPALGTGTGDITITTPPLSGDQCLEFKWDENAASQVSRINHVSNTSKQILITDSQGVAADGTVGIFWVIPAAESYL